MGCLSEKMLADMKLKGFARSTQEEYLLRARHFAAHYMRSPAEMGEPETRDYLIHLVNEKKASPASHHMYVASLKFLYATTLNRPEEVAKIPWPKKPRTLPDILSGEEVPWCTTPIEAENSLGPGSHHPIISLSGIPSAVMVWRILHPILASTLCAANPLARIAEPTIAL